MHLLLVLRHVTWIYWRRDFTMRDVYFSSSVRNKNCFDLMVKCERPMRLKPEVSQGVVKNRSASHFNTLYEQVLEFVTLNFSWVAIKNDIRVPGVLQIKLAH